MNLWQNLSMFVYILLFVMLSWQPYLKYQTLEKKIKFVIQGHVSLCPALWYVEKRQNGMSSEAGLV